MTDLANGLQDNPELQSLIKDTDKSNPQKVYRIINKVFKSLESQLKGDNKYAHLISALKKVIGLYPENLTSVEQSTLVECLGSERTSRLLTNSDNIIPVVESMLNEDTPSIDRTRATTLAFWFDMLMQQLKKKTLDKDELVRLGRRVGFELINALADRHIRT